MQQHLFLSRKYKIAYLLLGLTFILGVVYLYINHNNGLRIHCSGQIDSVFGDNQTLPEFSGIYAFIIDGKEGYISVNGIFKNTDGAYTVQRVTKINIHAVNGLNSTYELQAVSGNTLTGDNLPEFLYTRYIFNPVSVITVDKTLGDAYLVRNLYAPVMVCIGD